MWFYILWRQISFIPLNVTYGLAGKKRWGEFPDLQLYFSPENAEYSVMVNFITPSRLNITVTSEVKVNYKRIVKSKLCLLLEFDQSSPSDDYQRIIFYHFATIMIYWSVAVYIWLTVKTLAPVHSLRKKQSRWQKISGRIYTISIFNMIMIRGR